MVKHLRCLLLEKSMTVQPNVLVVNHKFLVPPPLVFENEYEFFVLTIACFVAELASARSIKKNGRIGGRSRALLKAFPGLL